MGKDRMGRITEQEIWVSKNEAKLKEENAIVDDIKKDIYFSLEQRRAAFNENFSRLASEYFKWASAYSQVVEGNEQEDLCIAAMKKAELAMKWTQIQKPEVFQVAENLKQSEGQANQEAKEPGLDWQRDTRPQD